MPVNASLRVLVLVKLKLVVLHLVREVGLALVLLTFDCTTTPLALEEGLIVDARGYFVGLHVILYHFFV